MFFLQGDYPFSESDDYEVIIGTCYLYVQSLAYLVSETLELVCRLKLFLSKLIMTS